VHKVTCGYAGATKGNLNRMQNSLNTPDELERLYRSRLDAQARYRDRVWKILTARFFSRYISADATVLDLGCGHGDFINNIECRKKFAMDLNPDTRCHLNSDVIFVEQDCCQPWNIADAAFDLVFSSNFFEHLPSKKALRDILLEARRSLRPGGLLVAMGPNIRFVGGAYWDFWDHQLPLTDCSMAELLQVLGFHIEESLDRFLPYTLVNSRPAPSVLVNLYLRMPLAWKIFGKQFLVAARKR
jgi:SAM-dependent methyltransferase